MFHFSVFGSKKDLSYMKSLPSGPRFSIQQSWTPGGFSDLETNKQVCIVQADYKSP